MISTQALVYLGLLLGGWAIRHWLPPASSGTPSTPSVPVIPGAPSLPVNLPNNPILSAILSALFKQGGTVVDSALHDWLANGLPQIANGLAGTQLPSSTQHPLVAAANQVASQAGQAASANTLNSILSGLQAAQTPAAVVK